MSNRRIIPTFVRNTLLLSASALLTSAFAMGEDLSRALPPQPLEDALDTFAKLTGLQVVYRANLAVGIQSQGSEGGLPAQDALGELLRGTGLTFSFVNDHTVAIRTIGAEKAKDRKQANNLGESEASADGVTLGRQRSFWSRFQLAQVDQGGASSGSSGNQPASPEQPAKLEEVVVTASRRRQTLEEVPYSITAVSAEQLANTGVTDIASLTSQVPGLSMYDRGTRFSGATSPVIRGINVTAEANGFRTFEQSPVGTYIGNSPIDGYFQLDDIQRVEVLRGPQGTLYGAGALGGALRIIPTDPELDKFSGRLEMGGGTVAHSSGASYAASAMVNVPIADTLAFRASGKYAYEPGFIDVYGLLKRTGSPLSGIPVLADPADPVNSSGVFSGKNDWNHQDTFTGRASLLWKPVDPFNAQLAFIYANVNGDGGPVANPAFPGGAYPADPRITFPRGGEYQYFRASDEPFSRRTTLATLDLSYDAGFATLSSTSSYSTTNGSLMIDSTHDILAQPFILAYYAGNPVNPRFVYHSIFTDRAHTFTQEVRLVSKTGPDKLFDYVVGLFYENQQRTGVWDLAIPGSPEYSVAEGCTGPFSYPGTFPNCLVISGPGDRTFLQVDTQQFRDTSEFGELTWHFVKHGQITFGGRHFKQSFTDAQLYHDWPFPAFVPAVPRSSPASKNVWKINPSYEYAAGQYVYTLWSQGFRRGGANSVPPTGFFQESPLLSSYGPDSTNNYEVGLKGRFASGLSYTFDVFDILWDKPQVAGSTPIGNLAVWNANKAESKGAEFDLNSPLFLPGLSITAGAAYADAKLTQDYSLPGNEGTGVPVPDAIHGKAGQQLPGSSKSSAAVTINYNRNLAPGYDLTVSLNDTYRSAMFLSSFPGRAPEPPHISGMDIANLSAAVAHDPWRVGVYVTNITDKRTILAPPGNPNQVGYLTNNYLINQPRHIELRLLYSF